MLQSRCGFCLWKATCRKETIKLLHRVLVAVGVDQLTVIRLIADGESNKVFESGH